MNEKYFHGLKTLVASNALHSSHSSEMADLLVENVSVGTIVSTEDGEENVFGFASVLNVTTNPVECVQSMKRTCLKNCPQDRREEMEVVLSGKTKRPAGCIVHERMTNLPLEISEVLHQQLVLDVDWAVENAEGGEEERKSLDFGVFVRMAPAFKSGEIILYKYFEDEVFATNAEFVFEFDAPKKFASEEKQIIVSIVITKVGHRSAMKELKEMIHGKE